MFFCMVYKSGQIFLPFCHNARVWRTDRQTDGRTDGQTDGQTDRIILAIPRLYYMQRGKNYSLLIRAICCTGSFRPSVCQTRGLWQNGRKICPSDLYTTRNII